MTRKSDEIADAEFDTTSGEHATVGIIKKSRAEHSGCNAELEEMGMCKRREPKRDLSPTRQNNPPQTGRSRMDSEGNQDTLE